MFDSVPSSRYNVTAYELWILLKASFCTKAQFHTLQDTFFALERNERQESVAAFGKRLRSASLASRTSVADEILLNRFQAGLSARLQDQAMLVIGNFDNVVSVGSRLSSSQQKRFRERVLEVQKPQADRYGSQSEEKEP